MKTVKLNVRRMSLVVLVVTAIFAVSCNNEDDFVPQQQVATQDAELKSGRAVAPGDKSIAAIAIDAGFSELVGALIYVDGELGTGLVNLFLNGTDQYTVFAPTNEAFFALYSALGVNGITDLPAELVRDVLYYHVTDGRRAANSVVPRNGTRTISTLLNGATFSVDTTGMIMAVGNTATIAVPNISASNGIIHVIDTVILPVQV
jgi:transforming growth factor-beta-induced protein